MRTYLKFETAPSSHSWHGSQILLLFLIMLLNSYLMTKTTLWDLENTDTLISM